MNDFHISPIPGGEKPRDWGVYVERIGKEKREKEEELEKEAKKKKPEVLLFGAFVAHVKKILTFLSSPKYKGKAAFLEASSAILQYLLAFKTVLKKLAADGDLSRDPAFIQELSVAWQNLIDAIAALEWMERQKKEEVKKVKQFLEIVQFFPPDTENTLGYYLSEFAEKKWLPFPFMDLLQSLHEQNKVNPKGSPLGVWLNIIDHLMQSFAPKPAEK